MHTGVSDILCGATLPFHEDFQQGDNVDHLKKFIVRNPEISPEKALKIWKFIEDVGTSPMAAWYKVAGVHGGGSPIMETIALDLDYDYADKRQLSRYLAGIDAEHDDGALRQSLPAREGLSGGCLVITQSMRMGYAMQIKDKVAIVTGADSGIGRALAERFHDEGAAAVVVCDIDAAKAQAVADEIGGLAAVCDVADFSAVKQVVDDTEKRFGRVDLYCANAGILIKGGLETPEASWQQVMDVNLMAHVHAARACLPGMIARGGGAFLNTVSAAGLLSQIGAVTYTVSKHAALGFAEWLAITHGHQGIQVTVLCPQAVQTPMIDQVPDGGVAGLDGVVTPGHVVDCAVMALAENRFMALPHPEVKQYFQHKAADHDRWINAMQRLRDQFPEG